jgi:ubiquinol-cytochrome c reductase cytochrome b subunit
MMHFIALHENASNNPIGITSKLDRIPFHPYYSLKDLVGFFAFFLVLSIFVFFMPNALGDPLAYMPANPMQTPASIIPEFYFLPFYAILRGIPSKLLGVLAMLSSILILFALPYLDPSRIRSCAFRPLMRFTFWFFVSNFFILGWLGGQHPEPPFITLAQFSTGFYFSYFLILVPLIGVLENTLFDLATLPNTKQPLKKSPPKPVPPTFIRMIRPFTRDINPIVSLVECPSSTGSRKARWNEKENKNLP